MATLNLGKYKNNDFYTPFEATVNGAHQVDLSNGDTYVLDMSIGERFYINIDEGAGIYTFQIKLPDTTYLTLDNPQFVDDYDTFQFENLDLDEAVNPIFAEGIQSVTGDTVDNTDPKNPVINGYTEAEVDSLLAAIDTIFNTDGTISEERIIKNTSLESLTYISNALGNVTSRTRIVSALVSAFNLHLSGANYPDTMFGSGVEVIDALGRALFIGVHNNDFKLWTEQSLYIESLNELVFKTFGGAEMILRADELEINTDIDLNGFINLKDFITFQLKSPASVTIASLYRDGIDNRLKYKNHLSEELPLHQLEEEIEGSVETANVATSYDLDWKANTIYNLTMTGNTTFTQSNLVANGKTKTLEMILTGDFIGDLPINWTITSKSDPYVGTMKNRIIADPVVTTGGLEEIWVTIENLE